MSNKQPGFATRAIHVGQEPDAETGAVSPPIHPTSTYVQQELGKHKGYEYSRGENPTRTRLEQNLAALEGGVAAPVFASGMAAINAISSMYKSGDHSVCGHNVGLGGVVVCTKREQAEKLAFLQKAAGAILSPFECWLVLRGVRTLAVRMEQHDRNGRFVAEFLARHKKVKQVFYPGLPDHPQYELAQQQMSGFGSMITFETGSLSNAKKMLRKVRLCSLAESLGGVETLISHPATMTHGALGEKGRKDIGITDGMVRISVGIENVEDIMDDLDQALAAI